MATPPVEHSETLYRQVGPGGNPIYFDPDREPPVAKSLFLPGRADVDGLSLIRARFRSAKWAAYRPERPEVRFRLAPLAARRMEELALNCGIQNFPIEPAPDSLDCEFGEPWAHCLATRINRTDYETSKDSKRKIKQWAEAVASSLTTSATQGPFDPPTQDDPLRP